MKIQLDIPKILNRELKIKKAELEHANLQETIIYVLDQYFKNKENKR